MKTQEEEAVRPSSVLQRALYLHLLTLAVIALSLLLSSTHGTPFLHVAEWRPPTLHDLDPAKLTIYKAKKATDKSSQCTDDIVVANVNMKLCEAELGSYGEKKGYNLETIENEQAQTRVIKLSTPMPAGKAFLLQLSCDGASRGLKVASSDTNGITNHEHAFSDHVFRFTAFSGEAADPQWQAVVVQGDGGYSARIHGAECAVRVYLDSEKQPNAQCSLDRAKRRGNIVSSITYENVDFVVAANVSVRSTNTFVSCVPSESLYVTTDLHGAQSCKASSLQENTVNKVEFVAKFDRTKDTLAEELVDENAKAVFFSRVLDSDKVIPYAMLDASTCTLHRIDDDGALATCVRKTNFTTFCGLVRSHRSLGKMGMPRAVLVRGQQDTAVQCTGTSIKYDKAIKLPLKLPDVSHNSTVYLEIATSEGDVATKKETMESVDFEELEEAVDEEDECVVEVMEYVASNLWLVVLAVVGIASLVVATRMFIQCKQNDFPGDNKKAF